ncbi:ABC transporter ATP-binding protein [Defluviimonas sp. SAOS-178_SWC]|uniref:ABC transporter ATP-binding protein n=1 Tax=Defluviimonas sp. SAOS-178_SWC TaxID=3121287 RepID=UPI003221E033
MNRPVFEIDAPALRRSRQTVLEGMQLSVPRGGLTAIVGPNGAGKSTLLRAIAGLAGERVTVRDGARVLGRREIGFLPQAFEVRSELSVLDCVLLGRREEIGWRIPSGAITEAEAILARFGLDTLSARPMQALSGGQQQRVLLVQRIFRGSALLALDEPTSALDLHHQLAALEALRTHARQTGTAVIAALHDLSLAARFCGRIVLLAEGRLICQDSPDAAFAPEVVARYWQIAPELLRDRDANLLIVPHSAPGRTGAIPAA